MCACVCDGLHRPAASPESNHGGPATDAMSFSEHVSSITGGDASLSREYEVVHDVDVVGPGGDATVLSMAPDARTRHVLSLIQQLEQEEEVRRRDSCM